MRQRLVRIALVAMCVSAGAWALNDYRISHPNREHAMTELTKTMRPFCVGRFLIDVPVQAKPDALSQSIMGMGSIDVATNVTHATYDLKARDKEAELRAKPHTKEGSVLHDAWRPEGVDATFLTFRDDKYSTEQFSVLAYFWRDRRMFTFHSGASNTGVQEAKDRLMRDFALIQPRANDEIPQAAGSCIESAFVPGSGYRSEHIGASFDFPDYPRLHLVVSTGVKERPDEEGLLARVARQTPAFEMKYPNAKVRTPRRAKRTVNGAQGEELIEILQADKDDPYRKDQGNSYDAKWEFVGVAKSMEKPSLDIILRYDDGAPDGKKLTEEEFLALWDAVVNSLRPRPGAF